MTLLESTAASAETEVAGTGPGRVCAREAPAPFAAMQAAFSGPRSPLRSAIDAAYRRGEGDCVAALQASRHAQDDGADGAITNAETATLARRLVVAVRNDRTRASGVDALMQEFSLSSEEGVALMCMAEALLRIPDPATADRLIADKLGKGDWRRHLGESPSLFVNAATWGLLITGTLVATRSDNGLGAALTRLIAKGGEPLVRKGVDLAMRMLGNQFVVGQTIAAALANSRDCVARGYQYSYDMLGEAALTAEDAERYSAAYRDAIHAIGSAAAGRGITDGPGISVKLSALHPRYSLAQRSRVMQELLPRLKSLVLLARRYAIGINIDAEEADRLDLSLDLLEALAFDVELDGFDGLGFVVQAYQKRCPFVIDWLVDLAHRSGRKFMVRLVKGAYWDSEIKRAQVDGMQDYPVFTRKLHTDMSYLVCARKLLAHADVLYPQFATHNAQTLAAVHTWARAAGVSDYEFQCLHGMGETLYDQVVGDGGIGARCRIYAPVGPHRTLLAYLVRRLLENGANSSFVNRLVDPQVGIDALIADPFAIAGTALHVAAGTPHPAIPLPCHLYGAARRNSEGVDFSDAAELQVLATACLELGKRQWEAGPMIGAVAGPNRMLDDRSHQRASVLNPADHGDVVGHVVNASAADIEIALASACASAPDWAQSPAVKRGGILRRAADLLETHRTALMTLAVREAGKTLPNAAGEVREAVDFLRFYAAQIESMPAAAALGVVLCISPWNFPLAIFIGQISAALAAGNAVLAKPAEQTPLMAAYAVALMHEAGVPLPVLQLLPGPGATVGGVMVADARVRAVVFTGSTGVAQSINRILARRSAAEGCEIPLIAETGGQNAMIVDSSALPEQVVQDALASAFDSAGQRCSALRVLCLQEDIADTVLAMLRGALAEWSIGVPDRLSVDVGPVIDEGARKGLRDHVETMRAAGCTVYQMPIGAALRESLGYGTFMLPTAIEIDSLAMLEREVFGPVLHVLRYQRSALPALVDAINATGYRLTLGVHSRIDETIDFIIDRARAGNIYINRNIIGAVVGSQPFGGEGLSGTGPKAGGPLYLRRLQKAPESVRAAPGTAVSLDSVTCVRPLLSSGVSGLTLPGPTGERNSLTIVPRGVVLCLAPTAAALWHQLDAVIGTGNRAMIIEAHATMLPQPLAPELTGRLAIIATDRLRDAEINAVLVDEMLARNYLEDIAARDGALLSVIITNPARPIDPYRLVSERTVTVNTTAAGGNANLMTLGI